MVEPFDKHLHDELQSLSAAYVSATSRLVAELGSGPIGRPVSTPAVTQLADLEAAVSAIIRRINKVKGITRQPPPSGLAR